MSLTGFIVLYSVIWFVTLWCILPIGLKTQGDVGEVVDGTPEGAPNNLRLGRKMLLTTIIATAIWLPIIALIAWSGINIVDLDPWKYISGS